MTFGLIGYPLSHSFSQPYFTEKFAQLGCSDTHRYLNFPLADIAAFPDILAAHPDLRGINVTIPHKRAVMPFLDELSPAAAGIGAVNTILVERGRLTGYNTDVIGFRDDLLDFILGSKRGEDQESIATDQVDFTGRESQKEQPLSETRSTEDSAFSPKIAAWSFNGDFEVKLPSSPSEELPRFQGLKALVLGTGGASLAVHFALRELGIEAIAVSRRATDTALSYEDVTPTVLREHLLVVNTTPLGMYPKVAGRPALPYPAFSERHYCYDLVYNPEISTLLRLAAERGARTRNGLGMLYGQAEAAWTIWNQSLP